MFKDIKVQNFAFAFMQTAIVFAHYFHDLLKAPRRLHITYWSALDLFTLLLLNIGFIALLYYLFSLVKNEKLRSLIPVYYLLIFLGYFLGWQFYIAIAICVLLTLDDVYSYHLFEKNRSKVLPLIFVFAILWSLLSYGTLIFKGNPYKVKSYSNQEQKLISPEWSKAFSEGAPANVFVLLFDKLSYQELYLSESQGRTSTAIHKNKNSEINTRYSAFRNLARESWNFHNAFSPYDHTKRSVPVISGHKNKLEEGIFDYFSKSPYQSMVLTSYLPYCDWFKDLNYCKALGAYYWLPKMPSPFASIYRHLLNISISGEQITKPLFDRAFKMLHLKRRIVMQKAIEKNLFERLHPKMLPSFVYTHLPVPHPPYVFNVKGALNEKDLNNQIDLWEKRKDEVGKDREIYYRNNLDYANKFLARFIEELKKKKLYDKSLIIITADHSYQHSESFNINDDKYAKKFYEDKQLACNKKPALPYTDNYCDDLDSFMQLVLDTHVPLIVKMPNQRGSKHDGSRISNARLFSSSDKYVFDKFLGLKSSRIAGLEASNKMLEPRITPHHEK